METSKELEVAAEKVRQLENALEHWIIAQHYIETAVEMTPAGVEMTYGPVEDTTSEMIGKIENAMEEFR